MTSETTGYGCFGLDMTIYGKRDCWPPAGDLTRHIAVVSPPCAYIVYKRA